MVMVRTSKFWSDTMRMVSRISVDWIWDMVRLSGLNN